MMSSGTNTQCLSRISNNTGMSTVSIPISVLDILARAIREENGIKGTQIEKEVKVPPFGDDTVLYIKDTKYPTKNRVELINTFDKMPEYKTHRQKSNSLPI